MHSEEFHVPVPHGSLFGKSWTPPEAAGSPLVLIHDSLGCVALWRDFPEQLAAGLGRRVIAYDRLGFGQSDPNPATLDIHFVADQVDQSFLPVCDQLGIDHFVLFGHSVGGGMAAECAARLAPRCDAMITESAQTFPEDVTLNGIRAARDAFAEPGQLDRLKRYHGDKAEWVLSAWIDTWLSEPFAGWTLDAVLPRVRCPLLSLHGDQDEYGTPVHLQRFAALSGGETTTHLLPGCGHLPHRENPQKVVELVRAFLAGKQ